MKTLDNIREYNISVILLALCCFFAGMICGFFLAPMKKGVTIGSNNCLSQKNDDDEDDDEDFKGAQTGPCCW